MAYDAFISYSSEHDRKLAPVLRDGLQRLARPWHRRRALEVFVDQSSLEVSSRLKGSLQAKLEGSRWLVILLSESAASSRWVAEEVSAWASSKPSDHVALVLTSGEIYWDAERSDFDYGRSTAVPRALGELYSGQPDEPLWLDLRWTKATNDGGDQPELDLRDTRFRDSVATLAAAIHGRPKDELEGEDVRQHRRAVRLRRAAIAGLAVLTVAAMIFGAVALDQRAAADRNAAEAVKQQGLAEDNAAEAVAERLAAESEAASDGSSDLGILLALAGLEVKQTQQGWASLVGATTTPVLTSTLYERGGSVFEIAAADDVIVTTTYPEGAEVSRGAETFAISAAVSGGVTDAVALDPDGTMLALSLGEERRVTLYDLTSFPPEEQRVLGPQGLPAAFDPSGRMLAIRTAGGLEIWATSGDEIAFLPIDFADGSGWSVAYSRDGTRIAAGTNQGVIKVWDTGTWGGPAREASHTLRTEPRSIAGLAFSPDGDAVWFGGDRGGLGRWILASEEVDSFPDPTACATGACGLNELIFDIDVAGDGSAVVVASGAGARLWRTPVREGDSPIELPGQGQSLAIAVRDYSVGFHVVGGGADRKVRQWKLRDPEALIATSEIEASAFTVSVSNDASTVVTGWTNGTTTITDRATGQLRETVAGPDFGIFAQLVADFVAGEIGSRGLTLVDGTASPLVFDVAIDPTGRRFARSALMTYDATDEGGEPILIPALSEVDVFDFDGHHIQTLRIPNAENPALPTWTRDLVSLSYLPDGSLVTASAVGGFADLEERAKNGTAKSSEGVLTRWIPDDDGQLVRASTFPAGNSVLDVDTSPDGRLIATAGVDGNVRVYDTTSEQELWVAEPTGSNWIVRVEFAHHGSDLLAAAGETGQITVLDVRTRSTRRVLDVGHTGFVRGLAFSSDDAWLVSAGGTDGTVRTWDISSGAELGHPYQFVAGAQDVAIAHLEASENDQIIVGVGDGGIDAALGYENTKLIAGTIGGVFAIPAPSTSIQRACELAGRSLDNPEAEKYDISDYVEFPIC